MRRGYFTPPVLIILAIIIFAVAILIAINTDLIKRIKKEPLPSLTPSPSPISDASREPNSSAETANWKIYTNEKYSFSFSYPNSWYASYEICPHRENASYLVVFFTMIIPCEGPEADLFSDESPAKILDITTQAKFDLNKEFQKASEQDLKPEIIGLDGTTALKFTLLRPEIHGVTSIGVSFNRFEKGVVLYFTPKRNDVEVLDQILSTFKFVD